MEKYSKLDLARLAAYIDGEGSIELAAKMKHLHKNVPVLEGILQ